MKFLELQIKGFGKFHDRTISFSDGLNVIYGKNEAGKSTIHTFIRGMLFGIQPQRGRASKNDLYSKYEPWEQSGTYEGALRLEYNGKNYRIERCFQKNNKRLAVIDETSGKELSDPAGFIKEMLGGLTETTYNNTISIGQLKSATEGGMVSELKNYIANMNTSGNMALNITKATAFLKNQRKTFEAQLVPEAARSYTAILGEIKAMEREIASPEYENHLPAYQQSRNAAKSSAKEKQTEKEALLQKVARGRQVLSESQLNDLTSIETYEASTKKVYEDYHALKQGCEKKAPTVFMWLSWIAALAAALYGIYAYVSGTHMPGAYFYIGSLHLTTTLTVSLLGGLCFFLIFLGLLLFLRNKRLKKDLNLCSQLLEETFRRHLGDPAITQEAMDAFHGRMTEFKRLVAVMEQSEAAISRLAKEIEELQGKQQDYSEIIEKQQKLQWELEKKLELLGNYKTQAEALRQTLSENDRISMELEAIDMAMETMAELSTNIRDSFGLYLNKTASELIGSITGGVYTSLSIDENLNAFMNTPTKLVPMEQVSSGTMDQIYLALRLAAAKLIQGDREDLPLIFDDSFVLYDDERLRSALRWLAGSYSGQIIIFTCHQREAQMLTANMIEYHFIEI